MSSRLAVVCMVLCLPRIAAAADIDLDVEAFVDTHLGSEVTHAETIAMHGQRAEVAADILGYPYPRATAERWHRGGKSVWRLAARGRNHVFEAGFVLQEGAIVSCEVLAYHGERGHGVATGRFTRQFRGLTLRRGHRLSKRVHAITGATISSKAMINMARLALALELSLDQQQEQPQGVP